MNYLTTLPFLPETTSYSTTPSSGIVTVKLDGGLSKSRLDVLGSSSIVSCSWLLTTEEFSQLMAFYHVVGAKGSRVFIADLVIYGTLQQVECRFVADSLRINSPSFSAVGVSAELEVLEGLLDFTQYYNYGDYGRIFRGATEQATASELATTGVSSWCVKFRTNTTDSNAYLLDRGVNQGTISLNNGVASAIQTGGSTGGHIANGTVDLRDNLWHSVAVTQSDSVLSLYVNGALIATKTGVPSPDARTGLTIGDYGSGNLYNFEGVIADVRVYDKVLTPSEMIFIHTNGDHGTDPTTSDLVGWYLTEDDDALDKSGNDNDATLVGSIQYFGDLPYPRNRFGNYGRIFNGGTEQATASGLPVTGVSSWCVKFKTNTTDSNAYLLDRGVNQGTISLNNGLASAIQTNGPVGGHIANGTVELRDNLWHSIVVTQSDSVLSLYIDGALIATKTGVPSPATRTG